MPYEVSTRAESQARIWAGEGFIYAALVAHKDGEKIIKVGFSLRPVRRVHRDLVQFSNVQAVRLLGYIPGSMREELALHNRLYGRPRCVKKGDREEYPLSIVNHPEFPPALIFRHSDVYGPAPKRKRAA